MEARHFLFNFATARCYSWHGAEPARRPCVHDNRKVEDEEDGRIDEEGPVDGRVDQRVDGR